MLSSPLRSGGQEDPVDVFTGSNPVSGTNIIGICMIESSKDIDDILVRYKGQFDKFRVFLFNENNTQVRALDSIHEFGLDAIRVSGKGKKKVTDIMNNPGVTYVEMEILKEGMVVGTFY